MSNTYALNTTRGREFEVEAELRALGLTPWIAKRLCSKYVKEKREAVWFDAPYVPKLAFCVIPAIYWPDVVAIKHVIGKPISLSRRDVQGSPACKVQKPDGSFVKKPAVFGLKDFKMAVEIEYQDMARRKLNSEYQCQYQPGQALEILDGPFMGLPTVFRDTIKRAHNDYAKLRVSVSVFGRETPLEIDPDAVKAV